MHAGKLNRTHTHVETYHDESNAPAEAGKQALWSGSSRRVANDDDDDDAGERLPLLVLGACSCVGVVWCGVVDECGCCNDRQ